MQIKIFEGNYNKTEFYSIMGKYFAEPAYRKQMQYMQNKENTVWILVFEENNLIGFGSIYEQNNKFVFESSFVDEDYRKTGVWKNINEERLKYIKGKNKPVQVITKEEYLKEYWIKNGFEIARMNGRYYYLLKEKI